MINKLRLDTKVMRSPDVTDFSVPTGSAPVGRRYRFDGPAQSGNRLGAP